jgi:hypothetical protein
MATDHLPITSRMLGVGLDGSRRIEKDRRDDESASDREIGWQGKYMVKD